MFGHQEDGTNITNTGVADGSVDTSAPASTDQPPPSPAQDATPAPAQPAQPVDQSHDDALKDILSPAGGYPVPASEKVHKDDGLVSSGPSEDLLDTPGTNSDLAAIKIQALDELYPLIDNLNLNPEERYKTLMMMIQASDNQELVKAAYDAAHSIPDEKVKAQALLDIVNEINYFTQNPAE